VQHVMPHFVTRQIYTGAGKVGSEATSASAGDVTFQLSQRADFFEEEVGLETTLKRPIVNTRDEPHADAQKYRRLHVIVGDANLAAMDLQYHDVRPEKSLFAKLTTERLVSEADVDSATVEPPKDTRAYFRGMCLQRWAGSIAAANWDSLVFDLGSDPLRRVPMMEPLRGTAEMVDTLLEACSSPAELLDRLGS